MWAARGPAGPRAAAAGPFVPYDAVQRFTVVARAAFAFRAEGGGGSADDA